MPTRHTNKSIRWLVVKILTCCALNSGFQSQDVELKIFQDNHHLNPNWTSFRWDVVYVIAIMTDGPWKMIFQPVAQWQTDWLTIQLSCWLLSPGWLTGSLPDLLTAWLTDSPSHHLTNSLTFVSPSILDNMPSLNSFYFEYNMTLQQLIKSNHCGGIERVDGVCISLWHLGPISMPFCMCQDLGSKLNKHTRSSASNGEWGGGGCSTVKMLRLDLQ